MDNSDLKVILAWECFVLYILIHALWRMFTVIIKSLSFYPHFNSFLLISCDKITLFQLVFLTSFMEDQRSRGASEYISRFINKILMDLKGFICWIIKDYSLIISKVHGNLKVGEKITLLIPWSNLNTSI